MSIGLEVSKGMIDMTKGNIATYDGQHFPFKDNSFDLVTCVCVYHHIEKDLRKNFSQEVYRILKPNGSFVIFEHNPYNPLTKWIVSRTPVDQNAILVKAGEFRHNYLRHFTQHQCLYYLFFPKKIEFLEKALRFILKWIPLGGQYLYWVKKSPT
jgi:SAM-dependent methyltransferase